MTDDPDLLMEASGPTLPEPRPKRTSHDLDALLRIKYGAPEWLFLSQVGIGTGRRADGLALNLWGSRGMEMHGFEVKISRGDWLRELKSPQKADEIARYVDHWWLVVSDASVVREEELPTGWGLLMPKGGGLGTIVPAAKMDARPLDRFSCVSLIRAGLERNALADELAAAEARGYKKGRKAGIAEESTRWRPDDLSKLRLKIGRAHV